ncbi:MAG TPA: hypothetical protein VKP30_27670 [Polyangiaceae bacterium]|nr:hypothetical protein [Polyangiaceae bacterium]
MRARAPGKVVLSGAYSVLEGAPAIVAAVDRYVVADSSRTGDFLTEEVKAAGLTTPIWFDATALRHDDRKLGLGSSSAILVATLAAQALEQLGSMSPEQLASTVFPRALAAHRTAQSGGSGIDVTAACFGGILEFHRGADLPRHGTLPKLPHLHLEVWASSHAASTQTMLERVRAYADSHPAGYRDAIRAQADAATATLQAWRLADCAAIVRSCIAQRHALERLGVDVGIPIVTEQVAALADFAEQHGAAVLPAGAGGGDIALYVGLASCDFMHDELPRHEQCRLPLALGAAGVHAA